MLVDLAVNIMNNWHPLDVSWFNPRKETAMKLNMLGFLGFLGLLGSLGSTLNNAALYGLYALFALFGLFGYREKNER
jgi:hypothetical protein